MTYHLPSSRRSSPCNKDSPNSKVISRSASSWPALRSLLSNRFAIRTFSAVKARELLLGVFLRIWQLPLNYAKQMLDICQAQNKGAPPCFVVLYNWEADMKIRRREKQIGVRIRADQHAALREIAEREGYESVSDLVRGIIERELRKFRKRKTS